jgi:putative acetyltransferase
VVRPEPYGSAVTRPLTDALADELRERYGEDGAGGEPEPAAFAAPGGHFVVAYDDGRAVACGGLARYGEREGEIRRMYVAPEARGRGLGKGVLAALEDAARALGYEALRLETGDLQPEAIGLYERAGYGRIPCYGPYVDDPHSICFGKQLRAPVPATADEPYRSARGVANVLGAMLSEGVVGVYLHGSATSGCFNPARSDVDLLAVTERPLAPNERRALERTLLARSGQPYPIELSTLTRAQAASPACPWPFDFHYSEAHRAHVEAGRGAPSRGADHDLPVHVAVLLARGRTVAGPPAEQVFAAPTEGEIAASIRTELRSARKSASGVDGVLNVCRALAFARGAGLLSKAEGAAWAAQTLAIEWRGTVERARTAYATGNAEPLQRSEARELIQHATSLFETAHARPR